MTHYDQPLPCRPPGTKFSRDQVWRDLGEDVDRRFPRGRLADVNCWIVEIVEIGERIVFFVLVD